MNEARIYHVVRLFNEDDELLYVSFTRDVDAHLARINDKHGWHDEVTSYSTVRVRTRRKALEVRASIKTTECPKYNSTGPTNDWANSLQEKGNE